MPRGLLVVLDGGRGRGLSPLTDNMPQSLLRFGPSGRVLDFVIYNCLAAQHGHVLVISPYFFRELELYLRVYWQGAFAAQDRKLKLFPHLKSQAGKFPGLDLALRNALAGETGSLDYIAVLAGNHIYRLDYRPVIRFHLSHAGPATRVIVPAGGGRREPESIGAWVFSPRFLADALAPGRERAEGDLDRELLPELAARGQARDFLFTAPDGRPGFWREMRDLAAYWRTHIDLLDGRLKELMSDPAPGLMRPPAARLNLVQNYTSGKKRVINSMVAASAEIGQASVENAMVGPGVRIEDQAVVRRAVVLDGAVIRKGMTVSDALIEPGADIKPRLVSRNPLFRQTPAMPGLHPMAPPGAAPAVPKPGAPPSPEKFKSPQ